MCIKMMNNITTFKNIFQYQMADFSSAKPQLLWCQPCNLLLLLFSLSRNTGVGYHFLLQGIFLTQGSNPNLLSFLHRQALPLREALVSQFPAQGSNCIPCPGSSTLNCWTTREVLSLALLIRTLIVSFFRSLWPHLNPLTS